MTPTLSWSVSRIAVPFHTSTTRVQAGRQACLVEVTSHPQAVPESDKWSIYHSQSNPQAEICFYETLVILDNNKSVQILYSHKLPALNSWPTLYIILAQNLDYEIWGRLVSLWSTWKERNEKHINTGLRMRVSLHFNSGCLVLAAI